MVLEKTLEKHLNCKKIKPVNPKVNQPWVFIGRTDAEAELKYYVHLLQRAGSFEKQWCWERLKAKEEATEDEMVRQYHQLNGHEFEQSPGGSGGQRSLVCYSPWGWQESDMIPY